MTYEQQQYYQYYYVQQYFEYYKQLALHQQGQAGNPGEFIPPADFQNLDPSLQTYIQQIGYNQFLQYHHQSHNSYVQTVTNANNESNNTVTQLPQNLPDTKLLEDERMVTIVKERKDVEANKPLLSLAAYGSGSDSESEDSTESDDKTDIRTVNKVEVESYPIPTDETKIVIDKMALYVSKNGEQFEDIVKAKNDPRFDFLHNNHTFYKYYKDTLKGFMKENAENGQEEKDEKDVKKIQKEKKEKKVIAPVSFSIKKAKEEPSKEIKSALPVEESSDEEESTTKNATLATPEKPKSPVLPSAPSVTVWRIGGDVPKKIVSEKIAVPDAENTEDVKQIEIDKKNSMLSEEDPILEMMELTDGLEEKKDVKRAEDKIKDKIAAAAREKLALVTRDKALQLERKRRAAAFLKLKSVETNHRPIEINSEDSHNSDKEKSPLRRDSKECIEIIEIDSEDSPPKKKKQKKDKHKDRNYSRSRSKSRERRKEKKKDKDKGRQRSIDAEDEEYRKKKERRKKSHKRKHSKNRQEVKSKRRSKKRHRKSESQSSDSTDSIL